MVEEKQMILCNACGNKLRSTAKFCNNCGAKVDLENVKIVEETEMDTLEEFDPEEEFVAEDSSSEQMVVSSSIDFESIESYFFNYLDFLKETLMKPSSVFGADTHSWVFGMVSIVLFALFFPFLPDEDFWSVFVANAIYQMAIVSVLFLLNKYFLSGHDSYSEVLGKYGGLINSQVILSVFLRIIGFDSYLGVFILSVLLMNQLNLFNLYIFNTQPKSKEKLDSYYQVLISYVALIAMITLVTFLLEGQF